jgi:hypothetical protein
MAVGDSELDRSASGAYGVRDLDYFVERKARLDFFVRLAIDEDGDGLLAIEVLVLVEVKLRLVARDRTILVVAADFLEKFAVLRDLRQLVKRRAGRWVMSVILVAVDVNADGMIRVAGALNKRFGCPSPLVVKLFILHRLGLLNYCWSGGILPPLLPKRFGPRFFADEDEGFLCDAIYSPRWQRLLRFDGGKPTEKKFRDIGEK